MSNEIPVYLCFYVYIIPKETHIMASNSISLKIWSYAKVWKLDFEYIYTNYQTLYTYMEPTVNNRSRI